VLPQGKKEEKKPEILSPGVVSSGWKPALAAPGAKSKEASVEVRGVNTGGIPMVEFRASRALGR